MMAAARAGMYGPAAPPGPGAARATPGANPPPAVLVSGILHPPPGSAILPTGDYSHVKARGSSKMRTGASGGVRSDAGERKADGGSTTGGGPVRTPAKGRTPPGIEAYAASPSTPSRAR